MSRFNTPTGIYDGKMGCYLEKSKCTDTTYKVAYADTFAMCIRVVGIGIAEAKNIGIRIKGRKIGLGVHKEYFPVVYYFRKSDYLPVKVIEGLSQRKKIDLDQIKDPKPYRRVTYLHEAVE